MKRVELQQRSEQWKLWRREGITATESAMICAESPFKTPRQLWLEKVGRNEEPDLSAIPAVRFGIMHEDEARRMAESVLGTSIEPACGEYDADPRFRASFDGLTPEGLPVEIKCPGETTMQDVRENGYASAAVTYYQWQLQHQLLVAGADRGWLVFLDQGKILVFPIQKDEIMQEIILEKGKAFLESIANGVPPEMDLKRDVYVPEGAAIPQWMDAADGFVRLQARIEELEKELADLRTVQSGFRNRLVDLMGNASKADFGGVAVTVSSSKGSIDYKALFESRSSPVSAEELERFRGKPFKRVVARVTDRILSKGAVATNEHNAALQEAAQCSKPLYSISF